MNRQLEVTVFLIPYELGAVVEYDGLPSTEVTCSADSTIGELAERAASTLGQSGSLGFVSPKAEPPRRAARHPIGVPTASGQLKWTLGGLGRVTVQELEAAVDEGLFDGDPHALVLDARPIGNGGLFAWSQLADWLRDFSPVATTLLMVRGLVEMVADLGGGVKRLLRIWTRRRQGKEDAFWLKEFIDRHQHEWVEMGATSPAPILRLILERPHWEATSLARYLAIPTSEARRMLRALGYDLSPYGDRYYRSDDPRKAALRDQLVEQFLHYDPILDQEFFEGSGDDY